MHVCTVCVAERSRSRHRMMKHNGRMNLPMSTGCITIDRTLNLGSEVTSTTQYERSSWNSKPEPYHEQV